MKEGFCFGLGMMIGLLTPAVLILVVMSIAVGLRDWLLSRNRKKRESRSGDPESSKLLIFQTEPGTQHTEQTKYWRAVALRVLRVAGDRLFRPVHASGFG
jgi:hypothetical protein